MNTYNEYYRENVVPALMDALKVKSPMEVPRLKKITLKTTDQLKLTLF